MSERHEDLMHSMEKTMDRLVNAADEIGIQLGRMNEVAPEPEPDEMKRMVNAAQEAMVARYEGGHVTADALQDIITAALAAQGTGDAAEKCARCKGRGRYWEIHEYEDQEWITCPPCRGTGHAP
jgi:hypothetical protein